MKRLETMASTQAGVFGLADAARVGVDTKQLMRLVRARQVIRLRRGAYVMADVYDEADVHDRYRLRVLALMRSRSRTDRASHHSALALFGVDTFDVPMDTVFIETDTRHSRRKGRAFFHPRCDDPHGEAVSGIKAVSPAVACVQVAARFGFEAGLCAMDSAVHKGVCTIDELKAAVMQVARRWRRLVRRVIDAIEPLTESVGETRTRIILVDADLRFVPQVEMKDEKTFLGRVDFLVDGCVVVEFDGMVKYAGFQGQAALADEKQRESRIAWLGYEVVRVVWSELKNPAALVRRILEAKQRVARRGLIPVA